MAPLGDAMGSLSPTAVREGQKRVGGQGTPETRHIAVGQHLRQT